MNPHRLRHTRALARRGFTLIEILVALGIFSILLAIIMVPLNLGVNMTRIGSARTDTQQAAQATMNRLVAEIRGATFVFPNEPMRGITDKAPYASNGGFPYFQGLTGTENVCDTANRRGFANTSRLDFLTPATQNSDNIEPSEQNSIISIYAARTDPAKAWSVDDAYSSDLNPIALYRAQIPFNRIANPAAAPPLGATEFLVGGNPNAIVDDRRMGGACGTAAAATNQGARWLMHNGAGEPFLVQAAAPLNPAYQEDLAPTAPTTATDPASNTRISPMGVGLYAPEADSTPVDATNLTNNRRVFTPSTTFICEDTNGNGIIDRVTITLVMGKFDGAGAQNRAQSVRLVQTVDLPNTESRFSSPR